MFRGSTAIGKEYFENVPETKPYFYIAYLKREGDIYSTQCNMIVCIALKNKTIGFLKQNSNKRERDDNMKLEWTLFFSGFA